MVKDERRQSLRRLDDLLDALEQLNLSEQAEPTPAIAARLAELAVPVAERSIMSTTPSLSVVTRRISPVAAWCHIQT